MYFFLKKIYLKYLNNNKNIDLIINFIPYLNLDFQNFSSSSYFIYENNFSKEEIENNINKISKKIKINKIFGIFIDPKYMILLKYLNAKKNKHDFDNLNSNWGFDYYFKSIINRDKIFPNQNKIIDISNLITDEIVLNTDNRRIFIDKINSITKIKKIKIEKQIKDLNDNFLNKYLNKSQIKLIKLYYD